MKKYTEQQLQESFDTLRDMTLEASEKARVRARIVSFMKENPLHEEEVVSEHIYIASSGKSWSAYRLPLRAMGALALVLLFGFTAYAAESALPGDALYRLKKHVNEPLVSAMTVSLESKVRLEQKYAERRLGEVVALTQEERITPEQKDTLVRDFKRHIEKSKEYASKRLEPGRISRGGEDAAPTDTLSANFSLTDTLPSVIGEESEVVSSSNTLNRDFRERLKYHRDLIVRADDSLTNDTLSVLAVIDEEIAILDTPLPDTALVVREVTQGEEAVLVVETEEEEISLVVFTTEQLGALERLGIDTEEIPKELGKVGQECFVRILGTSRAEKIFEGALLNLFDILKVEKCFEEERDSMIQEVSQDVPLLTVPLDGATDAAVQIPLPGEDVLIPEVFDL